MSTKKAQAISVQDPVLGGVGSSEYAASGGYGVWEYQNETWTLNKESCSLGYHAGQAPTEKGQFEGQLVRKHCEPVLEPVLEPSTATP